MAGNLTWDLSAQAASALEAGAKNQGSGWFVPNRPLPPLAPDDLGIARALDYEVGVNLQVRPKIADHIAGYDYPTLRNLSNACDYIKIAVQTVIDRMLRMRGHVVDDTDDNQDEADPSPKAKQINSWFKHPDGINSRGAWTAKILRDMLEIDAPTVYCDKEEGVARVLDGATIAARIGENGDICSYQQIIKGLPAHDYSLDEIIWKPKNVASYKIYGQSPVEQIAFTVEIALRRQAMQLGFFTDGNIPAALIEAPAHWNSVQIAKANRAWALMRKGASAKNQATFIPNGAKPYPLDRDPSKNEFDEWLMSIVAFAFSFAKTPFVKEVNRATAETSQDTAEREGHEAMCNWLSDFYNDVINSMYGPGYRWEWLTDEKPDGALIADLVKAGKLKTSALLRLGFKQTELGPDGPAPGAPGAGGANPFQKTQPNGEPAIPPTTTQPVKAPASKPRRPPRFQLSRTRTFRSGTRTWPATWRSWSRNISTSSRRKPSPKASKPTRPKSPLWMSRTIPASRSRSNRTSRPRPPPAWRSGRSRSQAGSRKQILRMPPWTTRRTALLKWSAGSGSTVPWWITRIPLGPSRRRCAIPCGTSSRMAWRTS